MCTPFNVHEFQYTWPPMSRTVIVHTIQCTWISIYVTSNVQDLQCTGLNRGRGRVSSGEEDEDETSKKDRWASERVCQRTCRASAENLAVVVVEIYQRRNIKSWDVVGGNKTYHCRRGTADRIQWTTLSTSHKQKTTLPKEFTEWTLILLQATKISFPKHRR